MDNFKYAEKLLKKGSSSTFKEFVKNEILEKIETIFIKELNIFPSIIMIILLSCVEIKLSKMFSEDLFLFFSTSILAILLLIIVFIPVYYFVLSFCYLRLYFFPWYLEYLKLIKIEEKEKEDIQKEKNLKIQKEYDKTLKEKYPLKKK